MNKLYAIAGISKQGFHQGLERALVKGDEQAKLEKIIGKIRKDHPRMGCRTLYWMLQPETMGRDRFEVFCKQAGFYLPRVRRFKQTTDSRGTPRVPNYFLETDKIDGPNQVWVSDIMYYVLNGRFYYVTLILDVYTREIVGYQASSNLRTESTTLPALKMAVSKRGITREHSLVLHSDGGGQYFSKDFGEYCNRLNIRSSRAEDVYANAIAERLNRTIKNDYLIPYSPVNFEELAQMLTKAVYLYNTARPHQSLGRCTPEGFARLTGQGLLTKTLVINKRKKEAKKEKVNISITMV
ncbi:MAG: IS3 family transposase [Bacteroidales bacterium]|nr:IS3 family transposase [Bacteroidales bacterium]